MTEETRPLADFARSLVLACGVRLRERRRSAPFAVREKGDYRDIVTDHDLWVQEYLLSRLLARWPDHGVLGEEGARRPGSSPWTWVLDPIDGTTNYCQLGKDYAISLGLLRERVPVWGLVLDVASGRLLEGEPSGERRERPGGLHQALLHMGCKTMEALKAMGSGPPALCPAVSGNAVFWLRLSGALRRGGGALRRVCERPSQTLR